MRFDEKNFDQIQSNDLIFFYLIFLWWNWKFLTEFYYFFIFCKNYGFLMPTFDFKNFQASEFAKSLKFSKNSHSKKFILKLENCILMLEDCIAY